MPTKHWRMGRLALLQVYVAGFLCMVREGVGAEEGMVVAPTVCFLEKPQAQQQVGRHPKSQLGGRLCCCSI
jgi:hypothetical protein